MRKNPVICDNSALLWPILQSVTAAKLNMNVCMCSLLLFSTFTLSDKTNNGAGSRGGTVLVHLQYKCSGFSVKRKKQSWVNFFFTLSFLQVNVKRRLSALFFHKFCIKCLGITAVLIQSPSLAYEVTE